MQKSYLDEIEKSLLDQELDETRLTQLKEYSGEDRVEPFEVHEKLSAEEQKLFKPVPTKLTQLEKITKGFLLGKLWVVSATTGTGKTTFLRTLHHHFSEGGKKALWFSYEESVGELLQKFPKMPLGGAPLQHIARNLQWLEDRIIEGKEKYDYDIVMIDHLHYLIPFAANINQSSLIGGVMRELHEMAKRHGVLIFLVAHTSMIKSDRTPTLADIRDSSFIGQEADGIIILYRKSKDGIMSSETILSVQKNRRVGGSLGSLKLEYNDGILWEIADSSSGEPLPEERIPDFK